MASIHREISIDAPPEHVWSAARDVGALHTRLVPGFVIDTKLEDGVRVVTSVTVWWHVNLSSISTTLRAGLPGLPSARA